MSYIEFIGTILNILSVWLVARKSIWTWPVGNVAVVLFGILFYQIHLYSDVVEQIYFLVTGFYGWWVWIKTKDSPTAQSGDDIGVRTSSRQSNFTVLGIIILGTVFMGAFMARVHDFLPRIFPEPASYPYTDALTTVMSFVAQWLMVQKKIENWYLWIIVDVIGIWLYHQKDIFFVTLLYVVFLVIAVRGLINWRKELLRSSPLPVPVPV